MSNVGDKRTFLTIVQTAALSQWLAKIEERLKSEKPTYAQVAEWATAELGHRVTENNVQSIAAAFKISWDRRRETPQRSGKISALEAQIKELREWLLEANRRQGATMGRLGDAEAECQRLRVGLIYLAEQWGTSLPVSAGFVPPASRTIPVANGPK